MRRCAAAWTPAESKHVARGLAAQSDHGDTVSPDLKADFLLAFGA